MGLLPEQFQPVSTLQLELQPSPLDVSPSSQFSEPACSPSPQLVEHEEGFKPVQL